MICSIIYGAAVQEQAAGKTKCVSGSSNKLDKVHRVSLEGLVQRNGRKSWL
jgi:hypothetical protein